MKYFFFYFLYFFFIFIFVLSNFSVRHSIYLFIYNILFIKVILIYNLLSIFFFFFLLLIININTFNLIKAKNY